MSENLIKNKLALTNNQIKIIAMISMLIDHIGFVFFPTVRIFRIIGRLSFPLFAYMIAEGCRHTKNRKRYLGTILAMGLVFQIFYFIFIKDLYQGILITFSLSISIIFASESFIQNKNTKNRILILLILTAVLFIGVVCPIIFKEQGFVIDYNVWGIFLPVLVYFAPSKKHKIIFTALLLIAMSVISSSLQWWSLFTIPLLMLYNGERGKANMKYFFYIFYPLHLIIIYGIMFLKIILK